MRQIDSGYHDRFDYLSKKYTILLAALFFSQTHKRAASIILKRNH